MSTSEHVRVIGLDRTATAFSGSYAVAVISSRQAALLDFQPAVNPGDMLRVQFAESKGRVKIVSVNSPSFAAPNVIVECVDSQAVWPNAEPQISATSQVRIMDRNSAERRIEFRHRCEGDAYIRPMRAN